MEFTLRAWHLDDAQGFQKYADNEKIAKNMSDSFPSPCTLRKAQALIGRFVHGDSKEQYTRAIVVAGEVVGSIGVFKKEDIYKKSAEIGYWLGEPFWGRGIMSRAVTEVSAAAFCELDIVRIYANVFAHNIPSQKTLQKAGFTLEGTLRNSLCKQGKIYDSKLFSLLKEELRKNG